MSKATRATDALDRAGIVHSLHGYDYDPNAERIGMQAAESLGVPAHTVFKTLMAKVDGKPVCALVPSDKETSMKKLAAAFGGKSADMMKPVEAERVSGYKVGGISPFGQRRACPAAMDASANGLDAIYINGGQRGLQIRIAPADAARALSAIVVPLT